MAPSIARGIKVMVALPAFYGGGLRSLRAARRRRGLPRTPILVYHRVVDASDPLTAFRCRSGMAVTAANFEAQMRHLVRHYRVLPLSELVAHLRRGEAPPDRSAAITFDDGYADNYHLAYPILQRYGLPATLFLTTGFIGTTDAPWTARLERLLCRARSHPSHGEAGAFSRSPLFRGEHRSLLEALKSLPVDAAEAQVTAWEEAAAAGSGGRKPPFSTLPEMMTWEQVREMRQSGIEFGGHTRRHALLDREAPDRVRAEIHGCYADLTAQLGPGDYGFAYPNGALNDAVRREVRAAGFAYACGMTETLCGLTSDLFDLPRRDINTVKTTWIGGRFCAPLFEATLEALFHPRTL